MNTIDSISKHKDCGRHICNLYHIDCEFPIYTLVQELLKMSDMLNDDLIQYPHRMTTMRCNGKSTIALYTTPNEWRQNIANSGSTMYESYKLIIHSLVHGLLKVKRDNSIIIPHLDRTNRFLQNLIDTSTLSEFKVICIDFTTYLKDAEK